jgi:hypothetical protein
MLLHINHNRFRSVVDSISVSYYLEVITDCLQFTSLMSWSLLDIINNCQLNRRSYTDKCHIHHNMKCVFTTVKYEYVKM